MTVKVSESAQRAKAALFAAAMSPATSIRSGGDPGLAPNQIDVTERTTHGSVSARCTTTTRDMSAFFHIAPEIQRFLIGTSRDLNSGSVGGHLRTGRWEIPGS
jgi:hypothetical protein